MYKMQQTNIKYSAVYPKIIPARKKVFTRKLLGHQMLTSLQNLNSNEWEANGSLSWIRRDDREFQMNVKSVRKAWE